MNRFEIFIAYISWGSGGKSRPVLFLRSNNGRVSVYPVTTQYNNKSEAIRKRYFKINDWKQAGLNVQSYVDTGTLIHLPASVISNKNPIGKLTVADKKRLFEFLSRG
ncbi:MAG: hypothetical protein FWE86_03650 [Oscillospiraceae bacterium]|nr:hypothetical protein [Oscillospiraceae bacterium]